MIYRVMRQVSVFAWVALFALGTTAVRSSALQVQASTPTPMQSASSDTGPTVAPLTADQLDALVAPIALYPDGLVAQILGAASSPDQIAIAAYWLGQNKNLTGSALAQAVDRQTWDPGIKALTQFPSVLNDLAGNLAWTSDLGQAFENQQSDVMAAVQTMRAKAQAAGTLQSTPQIKVVQQAPQTIVIQPANPDVIYVPQYNPTVVYGSPLFVPLYTPLVVIAPEPRLFFGAGVALGGGGVGFFGGGFAWGFHSWNCNWGGGGGGTVIYQHNTYIHNTTYINNRTNYNGYHPWGPGEHGPGQYGPHPYSPGGRPAGGGYSPGVGRTYSPNGGGNGDHGLIGGNAGIQRPVDGNRRFDPDGANDGRANSFGANQSRSRMSGNGNLARAEANRGRASMHPAARPPAMHAQGPRGGGRR
jgi:Protein of unknown function (DUF3300)